MPPKAKKDDKAKSVEKNAKDDKKGGKDDKKGGEKEKKGHDKGEDAEKTKHLMESGLLEAYEYVIKSLYKAGMPEGNIFEFTSSRILKFEHKWNTEQKKKAILERYKSMGKEDPKAILERSIIRSERSMSAKTSKSVKKEEPKGKDAKGKEPPKGKEAASKSKEPAKPKKK